MGKGEIARYEQFLLFPQRFQKACFPGASKGVIVWEWVKQRKQKIWHRVSLNFLLKGSQWPPSYELKKVKINFGGHLEKFRHQNPQNSMKQGGHGKTCWHFHVERVCIYRQWDWSLISDNVGKIVRKSFFSNNVYKILFISEWNRKHVYNW